MNNENTYDVVIIGGGPAGLTAAVYTSRAELRTLIIEAGMPGGKITLTPTIENWPGYAEIAGNVLAEQMTAHAGAFGAELISDYVSSLVDKGSIKEVHCGSSVYYARSVIIASGTVERHLNVPGEKKYYGMGVSYCAVCDGAFYRNKQVVVIGGGNSAFEDAIYLTRYVAGVKIITRRDVARAEKTLQTALLNNPKIEWLKNYKPVEITGDGEMVNGLILESSSGDGTQLNISCDGVFPMVGLLPNTSFLQQPDLLDEEGFIKVNADMATSIPGVFAAGDVNVKKLRQIVTATADGCIAAQSAAHYLEELA